MIYNAGVVWTEMDAVYRFHANIHLTSLTKVNIYFAKFNPSC